MCVAVRESTGTAEMVPRGPRAPGNALANEQHGARQSPHLVSDFSCANTNEQGETSQRTQMRRYPRVLLFQILVRGGEIRHQV